MLTLRCRRSKGNERLAWVVAHPPKVGEGRAPAFVVGMVRRETWVGHPPAQRTEDSPEAASPPPERRPVGEAGLPVYSVALSVS